MSATFNSSFPTQTPHHHPPLLPSTLLSSSLYRFPPKTTETEDSNKTNSVKIQLTVHNLITSTCRAVIEQTTHMYFLQNILSVQHMHGALQSRKERMHDIVRMSLRVCCVYKYTCVRIILLWSICVHVCVWERGAVTKLQRGGMRLNKNKIKS